MRTLDMRVNYNEPVSSGCACSSAFDSFSEVRFTCFAFLIRRGGGGDSYGVTIFTWPKRVFSLKFRLAVLVHCMDPNT